MMMSASKQQLTSRFEEFLQTKQLLTPETHVLLAVSGGVDSMTMLHLFAQLQPRWKLTLGIAHVNHQLRGDESDSDEAFVRAAAESFGFPFFIARVDTLGYAHQNTMGKQEAARELRYRFFEEARQQAGAGVVATAHNADDNAETVLMNALRGSGVHGLAGIPIRREQGNIIRPLLFAYRNEIEKYARENGVTFRNDSSNESIAYTRNQLRLNVIPLLERSLEINVAQSLNRISAVMREVEGTLNSEVGSVLKDVVRDDQPGTVVDIPSLLRQSPLVQDELVLSVFRKLGVEPQAEKIFHVLELCSGQTGRALTLSRSVVVYHDRDRLVFAPPAQPRAFELPVEIGKRYQLPDFTFASELTDTLPTEFHRSPTQALIDSAQVGAKLVLRNWKPGDWFVPLGMNGKKKLSDFFVDAKVPLFEKQRIPVLESDGDIVWVCGYRLDERFKVTQRTATVVQLQYLPQRNVYTP
ncbi:MAG TPA: tRNA lysidine(34) synthetase TilS [Bacteroidota bacterium]